MEETVTKIAPFLVTSLFIANAQLAIAELEVIKKHL
jgi:hypothetical protein